MTRYQPEELFRSTASYYARYRPGYPAALFEYLRERFRLDGTQRVLDLGSGPGQLAIPLAPLVGTVIAVDPEPSMLREGARLSAARGIPGIDWRVGDSNRLAGMGIDDLDLVTMGASFHWTDRPELLRLLDRLVRPAGAVVVASGGAPGGAAAAPWQAVVDAVRVRWLGPERRAGSGTYRHPEQRHEDVVRLSPFSQLDIVSWTWPHEYDLDALVGLQFSYSYSSPAQLGDNAPAFEADLRRALTEYEPSGRFYQDIHTQAIIATREVQE